MSEESNKLIVRAVFQAIDQHDLPALQVHPGMHETIRHIPMMWTAFPDLVHTIEYQITEGDMVATCATVHGRHQGPFLGMPPTGKEVAFLVLSMNKVADGVVVLHYGLPDWMALLGPLGVLPSLAHA